MRFIFTPAICALALVTYVSCMKDDTDRTVFVNSTDNHFVTMASYSNHAEIDGGYLASGKGTRDSVKMFAQMMITDHLAAQAILDSIAAHLKMTIPQNSDTGHIASLSILAGLSGPGFDTAYINGQVNDHQAAIKLFEDELKNGSNQQIKDFAGTQLPKIKLHYTMAMAIAKSH
jgi:putative membrane protein